ncbi:MAG: hypothetical protein ACK2UL_01835 [Anaerolineae bacterium]
MRRLSTVCLALLVAYVVARGLLLVSVVPPFQGPDEPGHFELAAVLARDRSWPPRADMDLEALVLTAMARADFYRLLSIPRPSPSPQSFADVERLGTAPTQLESETPLGYLPHALAYALGPQEPVEPALRRARFASLALAVLAVVAAAWAGAQALGPVDGIAVGALAAATPMLAFGGAVVNNDLAAAALGAVWFGLLARSIRRGATGRDAVLLMAVALAAVAAKRTALFLLPMLLAVPFLVGSMRLRGVSWRLPDRRVGALAAAAIALAAASLWWPMEGAPAGWDRVGRSWGDARSVAAARTGDHGFSVADEQAREWQYLAQSVPVDGGGTVRASAWARSAAHQANGASGAVAQLVVSDDRGTWLAVAAPLDTSWRRLVVTGTLADGARAARLAIVPGAGSESDLGALHADDLSLVIDGTERLSNPGAERPRRLALALSSGIGRYTDAARVLRAAAMGATDPLASAARAARSGAFMFRSYWGGFGWLTVWPPRAVYWAAALLTGLAAAGCLAALLAPDRLARDEREAAVLRALAVATLLAVTVTALGSTAGRGIVGIPQGRYLLTALVPLLAPAVALTRRVAPRWGVLAVCLLGFAIDTYLTVWVIWPAYRLDGLQL